MRVCKFCGKEFVPSRKRQVYCTSECRITANNERIKERAIHGKKPVKCAWCGKEFLSQSGRKYCQELCKALATEERNKAKRIPEGQRKVRKEYPPKPCAVCGKEFTPKSGTSKYCSLECKAKAKRAKLSKKALPKERRSWGDLTPEERWHLMTLTEVSREIARLFPGMSFGQVRLLKEQGKLPKEFGTVTMESV